MGSRFLFGKESVTPKGSFYDLGLTNKNYSGLVKLYDKYHSRGLEIVCFPCNQFGKQEPKSNEAILQFVSKYKGDDGKGANEKFHFMAKSNVNGSKTNEVFSFLKSKLPWDDGTKEVRWNFGKFLVSGEGLPYKRFGSKQAPDEMEDDIEELLTRLETGRGSSVADGEKSAAAAAVGKEETKEETKV